MSTDMSKYILEINKENRGVSRREVFRINQSTLRIVQVYDRILYIIRINFHIILE